MISACSTSKDSSFPQDFGRAAELFRAAANAGSPEAQYALATLYKDGRGVEKNDSEAARLLAAAALADNPDAQVEYAIALFNGTGVAKDEAARHHAVPQGRAARQPDRPEPPRADLLDGPRRQRQSDRGDQMASDRQGRRQQRPLSRQIRRRPARGGPRGRTEGGGPLACDFDAVVTRRRQSPFLCRAVPP